MKKVLKRALFIIPVTFVVIFIFVIILYRNNIKAVSSKSIPVEFVVEKGSTPISIVPKLKEADLIQSEFYTKVYLKINNINSINAGKYQLNKNMDVKTIFETISNIKKQSDSTNRITFNEGKNMRDYIKTIVNNTKIKEEDIYNALNDKEYIKSLINEYWFLTDDILNENIYYSLEGYLAPNTYDFEEDVTIKDVFKILLDQENVVLNKYKDKFNNSSFSIHQIITLASISELEGKLLEDRKNIIGVFINRMNNNIPLGSDVTTYYAAKVDMGERDLTYAEIIDENPYNTRPYSSAGKMPIGPICNPSIEAIDSVLEYTTNDYFYFVADKNGKLYFSKTENEHTDIIDYLKENNLWYEYE